jgi:hypothetical protein
MQLAGDFFTVRDMAEKLGRNTGAVKMQLLRLGIKPIARDALYEKSALEAIRNVPGKGRPKKQPEPEHKPRAKK